MGKHKKKKREYFISYAVIVIAPIEAGVGAGANTKRENILMMSQKDRSSTMPATSNF